MPIPTDTFWNVKLLNKVFAISAVLLVAVTVWAIVQDYDKEWRRPQQSGRVWEAALVTDRIEEQLTDEQFQQRKGELEEHIARQSASIQESGEEIAQLEDKIRAMQSRLATLEFELNTQKSILVVAENEFQDTLTLGNTKKANDLEGQLHALRSDVSQRTVGVFDLKQEIQAAQDELKERTAALAELESEHRTLVGDLDGLQKKRAQLQPQGLLAKLSSEIRAAPLMQFINPADRVQQVVLPEILTDLGGFKQVESIDRCMTCHVNISNKQFSEENVVAYLEEQASKARSFVLPKKAGAKASDPAATADRPGAVAMADYWHAWTAKLAPQTLAKNSDLKKIAKAIGPSELVQVSYDGQPVESFEFDAEASDPQAVERQNAIVVEAVKALYRYGGAGTDGISARSETGRAKAEIAAAADQKKVEALRTTAMKYAEELKETLRAQVNEEIFAHLLDRYRYALVDTVNPARKSQGLALLDASPVLLAHPRLDLYVSPDSAHPTDAEGAKAGVGCTSCHDGSGLETDFVLAAHTAKPIWVDRKTGAPVLPAQLISDQPPHQPDAIHAAATDGKTKAQPHATPANGSSANGTAAHAAAADGHHAAHPADMSSMLAVVYPEGAIKPNLDLHMDLSHSGALEAAGDKDVGHLEDPATATPEPYVDPVTGETGTAVPQMRHWVEQYEHKAPRSFKLVYHEWDWPMRTPQYLQANCMRCHTDVLDIKEEAPTLYEGRALFAQSGCVNCHQMNSITPEENRKVGTDLRHVHEKLSPQFINSWVWAPKAFRPSTKMPHFFMLENNSSDEELRRTRQEARAMTEYLMRTSAPTASKEPLSLGLQGDAKRGKEVFESIGCLGCHSNLNETGEKWVTLDLQKRLGMKSKEAKDLFASMDYNQRHLYALEHLAEPADNTQVPRYNDGTATKPGTPKPIFINHGPELSGVGTKLLTGRTEQQAREWLYNWVRNPRHYSEYTVMPSLRLDEQQAMDLTEYLLAQKRTNTDPDDAWKAELTPVDPEKLQEMTAFFLRNRFPPQKALEMAASDAELTRLATDALTTPARPAELAAKEVEALSLQDKQMVFLGKKLISHYGCMSCHAINGMETVSSPCPDLSDWGQRQITKLDFGYLDHHKTPTVEPSIPMVNGLSVEAANLVHTMPEGGAAEPVRPAWPHVGHTRDEWITQKLKNTRIYDRGKLLLEPKPGEDDPGRPYDKLKMPSFYFSDHQVDALVTFVLSNRDKLVRPTMIEAATDERQKTIARGRALAEKFNCVGCHQIEGNTPPVHQYYKTADVATKAPPSLRGEGNKIQHDWLFNFLKNVEPIRPLPVIRMPSFPLTDQDASAIAAYFAAASQKEAADLKQLLVPVDKYIEEKIAAAPKPLPTDPKEVWPGDGWYLLPSFQVARDKLVDWALRNEQIKPSQLDPAYNTPDDLARNYRTILFKARFTGHLYDAPYPFVDEPRPLISQERFALGEKFFYEMQCLKCHVLGDQTVEGANKTPTAPNLSLTQQRLQRRWVRHWMQEPPIIQAGTAMPPFFTGLPEFDLDGQTWPKSQGSSPQEVWKMEHIYGDTVQEQTDLVLDFLYAAGMKGYTGVQPAQAPSASIQVPPMPEPPPEPAKPEPKPQAEVPVEAEEPEAPAAAAPAGNLTLDGAVQFQGEPPVLSELPIEGDAACAAHHADPVLDPSVVVNPNGTLKNVVVWISSGVPAGAFPAPNTPAVLDQQGCMYEPHVLAMQTGQPLQIKNSDPFLHNVHSMAQINPAFNFGQPNVDPGKIVNDIRAPERFVVKCDVHPWMSAHVWAFEHPFFAITDKDGKFSIPNLPPGTYTVSAWHETYGQQEQELTLEPGKPAKLEYKFGEGGASALPAPMIRQAMPAGLGLLIHAGQACCQN